MFTIALFLIACIIDAWMDRMRECHQLLGETNKPQRMIQYNRNFWSYSPARNKKNIDGWHFLKYVLYILLISSIVVATYSDIPEWLDGLGAVWSVFIYSGVFILGRWIMFEIALKFFRKRMKAENQFKSY